VRRSSRIAYGIAWAVFVTATVLAWRKALAVEQADFNNLWLATVCGTGGMVLIGWWVSARDAARRQ
jgi:hypothetical protein